MPDYPHAGELLIGLGDAGPPERLSLLFQMAEGSADPDLEAAPVRWSVLDGARWVPLDRGEVRVDGTRGLINSGIVEIDLPAAKPGTSLPAERYWLRLSVDGDPTSLCDTVAIAARAVSAVFLDRGNDPGHYAELLPAEAITRLVRPLAGIAGICQPFTSFGGQPAEAPESVRTRAAERLRHRGRAVSFWDYEHLALGRFPQLYKAKCQEGDGANGPGAVRVIVIPDISKRRPSDPFAPKASSDLIADIGANLRARAPLCARVEVSNARFVPIKVRVAVRFRDGADIRLALSELNEGLKRFLSPWAYEDGADIVIGGAIWANSIIDFLARQPDVDYVRPPRLFRFGEATGIFREVPAPPEDEGGHHVQTRAPDEVLVSARQHDIDPIRPGVEAATELSGIGYMKIGLDFIVSGEEAAWPCLADAFSETRDIGGNDTMDIPSSKKARAQLKDFFRKNSIPAESNFADLIEAGVNQRDDGLVKAQGAPLSVEACGDDTSQKRALALHRSSRDPAPAVVLNLNLFANPDNPATDKRGLGISGGSGTTRVFVEPATGQLELGTVEPRGGLDVRTGPGNIWLSAGLGGDNRPATLRFAGPGNPAAPARALSDAKEPPRVRFDNTGNGTEDAPQFSSCIGLARGRANHLALVPGSGGNVGVGKTNPSSHTLDVNGFVNAQGVAINDGQNTRVGRGLRIWKATDTNHAIYSVAPGRPSPANKPTAQGHWDAHHRMRFRTHIGQGFLFENAREVPLVDIDADTGNLWTNGMVRTGTNLDVGGALKVGGSNIYFAQTNHRHTGAGNAVGHAAIKNDGQNYKALMILGRNVPKAGGARHRVVKIWEELTVHGDLTVATGNHRIKVGVAEAPYGHNGIKGEPNLWLDAAGRVFIKEGFQTRAMDVAERFPLAGEVESGDVLVYDAKLNSVRRCATAEDPLVVGFASGDPGMILGIEEEEIPIALCGRLRCKADADVAPIRVGDLLTTSATEGHARRSNDGAAKPGAIIGKALEGLERGRGEVLVFVMPR